MPWYKAAMQKSTMRWDDLRVFLAVARHEPAAGAGRGARARPDDGRAADRGARGGARGAGSSTARPQGYALTEAGRSLLAHAQAMESQARAAAEEIGGQADRLSGTVRIGAPDGVSNYLLVDACDALSRDNPELQVQVVALPRMFSLSQARGGSRDHRLAADRRAADGAQDRRLPAAALRAAPTWSAALGPVRTMADLRERARHRLHLGHDLRPASSTTTRCSGARPSRR